MPNLTQRILPLAVSVALAVTAAAAPLPAPARPARAGVEAKLARLEAHVARDPGPVATAPGLLAGPAEAVPPVLTVHVDCDRGQSVSEAVARSRARYLRVEIRGTCAETVVVERPGVTLSGSASGFAVIDPPDSGGVPTGPAVRALGAHELTLEDLVLTGGLAGLEAIASRRLRLDRVSAVANPGDGVFPSFPTGYGVVLEGSEAAIAGSDLSSNFGPLAVLYASQATVSDTSMTSNPGDGPFSSEGSRLTLLRCTMADNGFGPQAVRYSFTRVARSSVSGSVSDFASDHSELIYRDSTVTGMVESFADVQSLLRYNRTKVEAQALVASSSSRLELFGSEFVALPSEEGSGLFVGSDSYVQARRVQQPDLTFLEAQIRGDVALSQFSDAALATGDPISGAVSCSERSRASVNLPPAGGITGCE